MKRYRYLYFLLLILILSLAGCTSKGIITETSLTSAPTTFQIEVPPAVSSLEELLESIYTVVNPSVVSIEILQDMSNPFPVENDATQQYLTGLGSGFIWDTEGHIVTNNHVIEDADRISVTFYDGTTVEATLVGVDPDSDLAVIKVTSALSQPVMVGDSSRLKVGQLAVAIGNPFGYQNTMTVGFISGLGRLIPAADSLSGPNYNIPDIIQTDTSINPGNSGGVLLDHEGKVIGVTTAIATESGSSAGVGFAIPSTILQKVVPSLISSGRYEHAWLGISIRSLDPDLALAMNFEAGQRGALVVEVLAGSPAVAAGLLPSEEEVIINGIPRIVGGDVIIAYDGQTVKSSDDLITLLARNGVVGQTVVLTVLRDGEQLDVPVTLGARPVS